MSDDLITVENVTTELLKSVFDDAYMETSLDDEGDLRVRDNIFCYVMPSSKLRRIQLVAFFGSKDGVDRGALIDFANRVNCDFVMARCSITQKGSVSFDYDIDIQNGISRKSLVLTTKRFLRIPVQAIEEYGKEVMDF